MWTLLVRDVEVAKLSENSPAASVCIKTRYRKDAKFYGTRAIGA